MKRREFVKLTAMAGAAAMWPWRKAYAAFQLSPALQKFMTPLRMFGAPTSNLPAEGGIPIASKATQALNGVEYDYYEIVMREYWDVLHPGLGPTKLWGYANKDNSEFRHLGGAIVATSGRPVRVRYFNDLPTDGQHPLPVDPSVVVPYGVDPSFVNRVAPHLHGGLVPWASDGGPFHWFGKGDTSMQYAAEGFATGLSYENWLPDVVTGRPTNDYWYPNNQSPRMMWYHDHAVGITRLNAYAGLASGYLLTDPAVETPLMNSLGIHPDRQFPIPLVIQDKVFAPKNANGESLLWYPSTYDPQFFALARGFTQGGLPIPSLVPEFWGDTMLVNGTAYPTLTVYPRKYRFQILNACNTRFMNLQLFETAGQRFPGNAEPNYAKPGPAILQLGTEGGFLDGTQVPKGVTFLSVAGGPGMLLAPAERADVIIDFSKVKPGRYVILHNDAPVPFPGGTPLADFWPGNIKLAAPPLAGFGPNTRTLLRFYVADPAAVIGGVSEDGPADPTWHLPQDPAPTTPPVTTRDLALFETFDAHGRLAQQLGPLAGPLEYLAPPTETVTAGTVEIWRLFNVTADTHPIHFHYFNVRIISRQPANAVFGLTGKPIPPDPNEMGWKETVRSNPGECLTLLVDLPAMPTGPGGVSPNASRRTGNAEYVWHCHILEHEEHDMMRPLVVI